MAASSLIALFTSKMILQATSKYGDKNCHAQAAYAIQIISYDRFDDENTLCKAGAKTDVYETFKRMLARGQVPGTVVELLKVAI